MWKNYVHDTNHRYKNIPETTRRAESRFANVPQNAETHVHERRFRHAHTGQLRRHGTEEHRPEPLPNERERNESTTISIERLEFKHVETFALRQLGHIAGEQVHQRRPEH